MIIVTAYYRFRLNDQTGNHCARCRQYDGQVKSQAAWDMLATPPLHNHCGCRLEFDHADEAATPDSPGLITPHVSTPAGISGEIPAAVPTPIQTGPRYPPATPPATIPTPPTTSMKPRRK